MKTSNPILDIWRNDKKKEPNFCKWLTNKQKECENCESPCDKVWCSYIKKKENKDE